MCCLQQQSQSVHILNGLHNHFYLHYHRHNPTSWRSLYLPVLADILLTNFCSLTSCVRFVHQMLGHCIFCLLYSSWVLFSSLSPFKQTDCHISFDQNVIVEHTSRISLPTSSWVECAICHLLTACKRQQTQHRNPQLTSEDVSWVLVHFVQKCLFT